MDNTNDPQQDYPYPTPDRAEVRRLLKELERIPERLTPGKTRQALAEAIRTGEIDNLYKPTGAGWWNVALAGLPPTVDMRCRLAEWIAWWQAGKSPAAELMLRASDRQNGQG